MCGRFALFATAKKIKAQFHLDELFEIEPRYNIAPTEDILALTQVEGQGICASMFYWGLIPSWAEDKKIGSRLINARAETVAEKPAFRKAFQNKRCLVIMSGFFEWQQRDKKKQPYFIKPEKQPLIAIAGIWEDWLSQEGESIKSCSLLTKDANAFMKPLHDRMPVILNEAQQSLWLNPAAEVGQLQESLKMTSNLDLTAYPVTPKMSYAGYKSHQSIEPIML